MNKYYTSDITWCNCGCKNTKCERHICHLDRTKGTGFYSQSDYSNKCPDFKGKITEEKK